jgi:hypothetical protein
VNNLAVVIPEDSWQANSSVIIDTEEPVIFPIISHKAEVYQPNNYRKKYGFDDVEVIKYTDDLSDKSKNILGENGVSRFYDFLLYDEGWDFGRGEPLSKYSIAILDIFLNLFEDLRKREPSLFLTRSGNLQLSWEDDLEQIIEVEFFPNKIEYYIESNDEEGEMEFSDYVIDNIREFGDHLTLKI